MNESIDRRVFAVPFGFCTLALFIASFEMVISGAHLEPFEVYRRADGLYFVAGGGAAIATWLVWSLALVWAVLRRILSPWALAALALPVVTIFYLQFGVVGYFLDLEEAGILPSAT